LAWLRLIPIRIWDRNSNVDAWVKNDHLGFEIIYIFKGVVKKYRPDFIVRLKSGEHLILETKGQQSEKDKAKRGFLEEWVRAVNQHGGFGKWRPGLSQHPDDLAEILNSVVDGK
jgi:type III restriction enzyme